MDKKICIGIENLTKYYRGSSRPAIDNISLSICESEIFGIIGPNGAGKTTLISILCGLYSPSKGKVFINDMELHKNIKELKRDIGVVPQDIALYPTLTAKENLIFFGKIYGLRGQHLIKRINECMDLLYMGDYLNKKLFTFSGGMKRKINLIAGILHNPCVLFLDEPTVGIDVHSKKVIIDFLLEINKLGTTIIYTSHLMNEAEKLCTYLAIINKGKIIEKGSPASLISNNNKFGDLESIFLQLTEKSQ